MLTRFRAIVFSLTPKEKRVFYSALGALILGASILCIDFIYKNTGVVPVAGGEYTEGLIGQPTLINPVLASGNDVDRDLTSLLFSGLSTLSEKIEPKEKGAAWIVTLKKNLLWDDNEPLTSDDVVFTLNTIQNISTHSPLFQTWQGIVAERLSEREIRFTLKAPYAFFNDNLGELKIVPRHIFSNIPNANMRLSSYNLEPVGSGPYSFKNYTKNKDGFLTDLYLQPNPNFAGAKVLIQNFHVKFFVNSQDIIRSFNKLEINGFGGLDYAELANLRAGYEPYELEMPRYYAIFLNQGVNLALKDNKVRAALARATDQTRLVGTIFHDKTSVVLGPLTDSIEGYDPKIYEQEKFSLEEAQKILSESGWTLGNDGVREKPYGRSKLRLEFDIVVPQIKFLIDSVGIIKDDWAKIGIKLTPVIMSPQEITERVIRTRNYQMIIFGNILKNNPDVFAFWHSSERFFPGLNLSLYENKTVDRLMESIRKDFDTTSRQNNLSKLQTTILNDRPAIFLYSPRYLYITGKNLKGFNPAIIITPANRFDGIAFWYLKTKRVFK